MPAAVVDDGGAGDRRGGPHPDLAAEQSIRADVEGRNEAPRLQCRGVVSTGPVAEDDAGRSGVEPGLEGPGGAAVEGAVGQSNEVGVAVEGEGVAGNGVHGGGDVEGGDVGLS